MEEKEQKFTYGTSFVVELLEDVDGKRIYILRAPNGQPLKIYDDPHHISEFLYEFKFKGE